jgi:hypothetical protein
MVQEPDHSFVASVKVQNACSCTFVSPNVETARVLQESRLKFAYFIYFLINGS